MANKTIKKPESLKIHQLLPTKYEPKYRMRWIAQFDGLDSFLFNSIDYSPLIPTNQQFVMKPKGVAKMVLHCPIAPSGEQQVFDAAYEQFSKPLGDCVVKYLDPIGTVVSRHKLTKPKIVEVEFTPSSYDERQPLMMTVSFKYEDFVLEY